MTLSAHTLGADIECNKLRQLLRLITVCMEPILGETKRCAYAWQILTERCVLV